MRFRFALGAVLSLAVPVACAHVEAPPGGPEDETPPALLVTRPDSLAVVPRWDGPVVLVFEERVSERGVQDAVLVSPRTSAVVVDHRGDELRVRLREGWVPGTIYHVTVLPGVLDLFGNPTVEPATLVFSTGPEIPENAVTGVVTDPITGAAEEEVRVEAIRSADSLVYAVPTDSLGEFRIARIPEGEYRVRAFRDMNRNRALDDFEPRAAATVAVSSGETERQALGILAPDSTPPVATAAELLDSATVEITFDDYLDPEQTLPPAAVQIRRPDGGFVGISEVEVAAGEAPRGRGRQEAAADTAEAPRLPSRSLRVTLGATAEIEPEVEYSVGVRSVRNLHGLEGPAETTLEVPAGEAAEPDAAPADTAAPVDTVAPPDTAGAGPREALTLGIPEP